ncbi:MAG: hypothetical protein K0R65_78 [Crocinitomicaceae bacterium]|jgi:hypothetical protein|nr:hypothetical protein [Crocinitomicaceae bacterium]
MKMKHYTVSLLLAAAPISGLFGQNWLTAGNPATGGEILGTTTNFPLDFYTNNAFRMRLNGTGSLSIGTTSASSTLHVTGSSGEIFRTDGPSGSSNFWRMLMGGTEKMMLGSFGTGTSQNDIVMQASSSNSTSAGNIFFRTAGTSTSANRMRINGNTFGIHDTINGYDQTNYGFNTTGFVLMSTVGTSGLFGSNSGPYSQLHLNGTGSGIVSGYRPWMKTGVTFTDNLDLQYVGNHVVNETSELNEFVMAWGNTPSSHDDMVFRFITGGEGDPSGDVIGDPDLTTDLDGLNVARFTPSGNLAIGPNFGYDGSSAYTGPTERIDAEGNARLRLLPDASYEADGSVTKSVFVDADGVLMWKESYNIAPCSDATGGVLPADAKIDLDDNSFYFTNQGDVDENMVIIGYDCGATLDYPAKLTAYQNTASEVAKGTIAGSFLNEDISSEGSKTFKGIYAECSGVQDQSVLNIAGDFKGIGGRSNYGVRSIGDGGSTAAYGGYFTAQNGATNYGVYGSAAVSGGNRAGYFNGDLETTAASVITSDKRFKESVRKEENALETISRLKPVTYKMKKEAFPQFNFSEGLQHGIIAQELEEVLPELVHESLHPAELDASGKEITAAFPYKSVNYIGLITVGLQATNELNAKVEEKEAVIEELNKEVETLQTQLKNQEARLTQLENSLSALLPSLRELNQTAIEQNTPETQQALRQQLEVTLSNRNVIVLSQNVPNPFAESTIIQYNVPANVGQAQIHFYDAQGKLISSVEIPGRGDGELKVFANDLSSGMYTYNLVTDGKIVSSKKMMKK